MRLHPSLQQHILRLPASAWKPYREDGEAVSECADVLNYWPEAEEEKEFAPLRWVAIRIRQRQGDLFGDGTEAKHFAVVTNIWAWPTRRLREWHREKAGTIETIHDVLKNELAAGVLPCARFGANAAWLRMAVLTHYIIGEILEFDSSQAAEILEISPGSFRQRLSRARKAVIEFTRAKCGIVNSDNSCRCEHRVSIALATGRVDASRLLFATAANHTRQALAEIRKLVETRRIVAVYRSHPEFRSPDDFRKLIRKLTS